MAKHTIPINDETIYWRLYDTRQILIRRLKRSITWQEFLFSAVTGKPLKSQQELLEEADRSFERGIKKHADKEEA